MRCVIMTIIKKKKIALIFMFTEKSVPQTQVSGYFLGPFGFPKRFPNPVDDENGVKIL